MEAPTIRHSQSDSDSRIAARLAAANGAPENSVAQVSDQPVVVRSLATELKVIATVVAVVLVAECGLRAVEDSVSEDVRHLKSLRTASQRMVDASQNGELKVLFLGNSITAASIDADVITSRLRADAGISCSVTKVVPDNTRLADWAIAFDEFFLRNKQLPDVVVMGFRDADLRDEPSRHPDRLGRYYCDLADWGRLANNSELQRFTSHVEFLMGNQSVLFANRKRLRTGLLSRLLPGFVAASRAVNRGTMASDKTVSRPNGREENRYQRLLQFHRLLASNDVKLVLLAIPTPTEYALENQLLTVVKSAEIDLLDLRNAAGLEPEMFPDGLHMGHSASAVFSVALATDFKNLMHLPDQRPARSLQGQKIPAIAIRPETNRQ